MDLSLRVDPEHFAYLRLQKGNLDKFAHNFPVWRELYELDLQTTLDSIGAHLPRKCDSLLDVGSGLGGIDVLIRRYYEERGQKPEINLLDGIADPPEMILHRKTFNDMRVAKNFQVKNGVNPLHFVAYSPETTQFEHAFDLVVSFGSWCFHYPPRQYLSTICASGIHGKTVVICDVRSEKADYLAELETVFDLVTVVARRPKWSRCVFTVKS